MSRQQRIPRQGGRNYIRCTNQITEQTGLSRYLVSATDVSCALLIEESAVVARRKNWLRRELTEPFNVKMIGERKHVIFLFLDKECARPNQLKSPHG